MGCCGHSKRKTRNHCGWWKRRTSTPRCRFRTTCHAFPKDQQSWSVRWAILHVINELARHAGHADIVRETIDGATMYELIAGLEGWEIEGLGHALGSRVKRRAC